MPQVSITVSVELDDDQHARIARIFGVRPTQMDAVLKQLGAAALEEYVTAFSGVRSPQTISEFRENRLNQLYKHLDGSSPTDRQVEQLFQRKPGPARTLIAGVRARYETEVEARLRDEGIAALEAAQKVDDGKIRIVVADSLATYMKDLLATTEAPPMDKRRDAGRTYDLYTESGEALCELLGIPTAQVPALS